MRNRLSDLSCACAPWRPRPQARARDKKTAPFFCSPAYIRLWERARVRVLVRFATTQLMFGFKRPSLQAQMTALCCSRLGFRQIRAVDSYCSCTGSGNPTRPKIRAANVRGRSASHWPRGRRRSDPANIVARAEAFGVKVVAGAGPRYGFCAGNLASTLRKRRAGIAPGPPAASASTPLPLVSEALVRTPAPQKQTPKEN